MLAALAVTVGVVAGGGGSGGGTGLPSHQASQHVCASASLPLCIVAAACHHHHPSLFLFTPTPNHVRQTRTSSYSPVHDMNDQERSIIRALQHSQPLLKRLPNRHNKAAKKGAKTMPRDLEGEKPSPVGPLITASPNRMPDSPIELSHDSPATPGSRGFVVVPKNKQYKSANLHPYTRPLTVSDIEAVVALEDAAFPDPNERATREKLLYRLSKCGELSLGIFETVVPGSGTKLETLESGRPVETCRRNGAISVLIGHVIAAKATSPLVTDKSMDFPKDWNSEKPGESNLGHQEAGRTIVLHSVAVLPQFQGRGIGRILMMAYMQQMNGAGIADRLALIAHEHMTPWYEKLAFVNKGKSICEFGGGGWFDMVFDLKTLEARATYG